MSKSAQDSLYNHSLQSNNLFSLEYDLERKQPYPIIKDRFHTHFETKISKSDIEILSNFWQEKQREYEISTIERSKKYKSALQCQQIFLDSLMRVFSPYLDTHKAKILTEISKEELKLILENFNACKIKLKWKKEKFLEYEEQFTLSIDSSIYSYMKFGFELMERVPASKYYNVLGMDNSNLSFLLSKNLNEYYNLYEKFESELIYGLNRTNCRAHLAIPYFHRDTNENAERIHTIRNSLFYFVNRDIIIFDEIQDSTLKIRNQIVDSIFFDFIESKSRIENFITKNELEKLNLKPFKLGIDIENSITGMLNNHNGELELMVNYLLVPSENEKSDIFKRINTTEYRQKIESITTKNDIEVFYNISNDENGHSLKVTSNFEGYTIIKGELIAILITGNNFKIDEIKKYLDVLKN
ncbi:MAG: hypothetical protein IPM42_04000 [Saprospiraceae bacterium]|nr:hypothetical protein [Saprospiraceae bacterium]